MGDLQTEFAVKFGDVAPPSAFEGGRAFEWLRQFVDGPDGELAHIAMRAMVADVRARVFNLSAEALTPRPRTQLPMLRNAVLDCSTLDDLLAPQDRLRAASEPSGVPGRGTIENG